MLCVAGSGAFGTALAIALASEGEVTLLGRDATQMAVMQETRQNQTRLPGENLPESIHVTAKSNVLDTADIVLLCVPTQTLSGFLEQNVKLLSGKTLIACCKGIDLTTLNGPAQVIERCCPDSSAGILTGPSFAADIAKGLPTALTLAMMQPVLAERLQTILTRPNLRIYRSADVIGAQLGGALKNVIAIAAGTAMGARLGESARAALITRGFAEMQKLAGKLGAQADTLMGLSGMGDLILTCSSEQSRNYSLGLSIGRGAQFDTAITVEGATTAKAARALAEKFGLDLPVTCAVDDLVNARSGVAEALQRLLSRPLKEE